MTTIDNIRLIENKDRGSSSKDKNNVHYPITLKKGLASIIDNIEHRLVLTDYINLDDYKWIRDSIYMQRFINKLPYIILSLSSFIYKEKWVLKLIVSSTLPLLARITGYIPIASIITTFSTVSLRYPSIHKILLSMNPWEYMAKFKNFFIIALSYMQDYKFSGDKLALDLSVPFSLIFTDNLPSVIFKDINKYKDEVIKDAAYKDNKSTLPLFNLIYYSRKIGKDAPHTKEVIDRYAKEVELKSYQILNKYSIIKTTPDGLVYDYKKLGLTKEDRIIGAFTGVGGAPYVYYIDKLGENKTIEFSSKPEQSAYAELLKATSDEYNDNIFKDMREVRRNQSSIQELFIPKRTRRF
jgi:hypothetical protein